jgi:hypothetical protein
VAGEARVSCATSQVILTAASVTTENRSIHPKRSQQVEQQNMSAEAPARQIAPAGQKEKEAKAVKAEVGNAQEARPRATRCRKKSSNTNSSKSVPP